MSMIATSKALAWFIKGGWKTILRWIVYIVILCAVGWGLMKVYDSIYDRGAAAQAKISEKAYTKLRGEYDKLDGEYKKYTQSYDEWKKAADVQAELLAAQQAKQLEDMRNKLAESQRVLKQKEALINEISKVIPLQPDGTPLDLNGFVGLYNQSAEKAGKAAAVQPAAGSRSGNADRKAKSQGDAKRK